MARDPVRVAVFGAGAVGCFYGGMLARAGHEVVLIGRPAHVEAIQKAGLHFEGLQFDEQVRVAASTSPEAVRGARLVLFCVKSTDTEQGAAQIAPFLDPGSLVLNLQNGVDNTERIQARVAQQVIPAVVYVATEMAGPRRPKAPAPRPGVEWPARLDIRWLLALGPSIAISRPGRGWRISSSG